MQFDNVSFFSLGSALWAKLVGQSFDAIFLVDGSSLHRKARRPNWPTGLNYLNSLVYRSAQA